MEFNMARKRRNPPKDIDSKNLLGGECVVYSLAAVSGQTVPSVRRAFMSVGLDIWGNKGVATHGVWMDEWKQMIRHLGLSTRLIDVITFPKDDIDHGAWRITGDKPVRIKGKMTAGQALTLCAKDRVACLMVVKTGARTTHMVGYSPTDGYRDNLVDFAERVEIHGPRAKVPFAVGAQYRYKPGGRIAGWEPLTRRAAMYKKAHQYPMDNYMGRLDALLKVAGSNPPNAIEQPLTKHRSYDKVRWLVEWRALPRMKSKVITLVRFREHVGKGGSVEHITQKYPAGRQTPREVERSRTMKPWDPVRDRAYVYRSRP